MMMMMMIRHKLTRQHPQKRQFTIVALILVLLVCSNHMVYSFTLSNKNEVVSRPLINNNRYMTGGTTTTTTTHRAVVALDMLPPTDMTSSTFYLTVSNDAASQGSSLSFLSNSDVWIFLVGIFPFGWATVEFWRRIVAGESFGTGSDQVIIGMDDSPSDSRGRRVLGRGALITAYILFTLAFGTIGIVLYSVLSSDTPPEILPSVDGTTIVP